MNVACAGKTVKFLENVYNTRAP